MRLGFFLATGIVLAAAPAEAADGPVVKTEAGRLEGVSIPGSPVQIFRGIPYAQAPVGDLRWRAPRPAQHWRGVRAADQFGPRCMQRHMWDDMFFRSPKASEDCLYLNVWTPADLGKRTESRLPVLVYIYGGGFIAGESSEPRYDGAATAAQGIVVVTLNYRLGIFGFFSHPQLTAESRHRASGNYGLLDQAAALAWVKHNIAAFGGDPKRITIGGESAGSMSVSGMMVSPLTRNLIAGAIGESGSVLPPLYLPTLAEAEAAGTRFAQSLDAPTLAQLRAIPADQLLSVQSTGGAHWGPMIDGYYLPKRPEDIYSAGEAAKVPLLVGSNSQEGAASAIIGDAAPTVANYRAGVQKLFGPDADRVLQLYPAATDADVLPAATALASDRFIAAATWNWFDHQRRTGSPTFYYYYAHVRPAPTAYKATGPAAYGALHSAEIEYALGNLDANPAYAWTEADRKVSATMNGYFVHFIKTGNPNGQGLPLWPQAPSGDGAIQRQIIDVNSAPAPFTDQGRYTAIVPLLTKR